MNNVRWGIVSTGRISAQFAHDMQFVNNGELAAVAARNINSAQAFAEQHHIAKTYAAYQAMFDDPEIDAIYIGTPHTFHFDHAMAAIAAGKHVLCEKPITISAEQCIALSKEAKAQGVLLMEAMWTYFLPAINKAKQWIDAGRIGQIKHIKADFGYPIAYDENSREYDKNLAGGCLLDMGIYPLAIAHFFANQDLDNLHVIANLAPNGVDDDVIMTANSGKIKITLATSFQCRLRNSAYIIGDKGYIVIPDAFRTFQCSLYELDDLIEHFDDGRESLGFQFEAEHFGELIRQGVIESPVVSHAHSLLFQTQMERIKALF
ncbi:MAG: Gfo/Idh/MocA family protein [Thalassotalea sp.]